MSDWPKDVIDLSTFGALSTAGEGSQIVDVSLYSVFSPGVGLGLGVAPMAQYTPVVLRSQITVFQLGWLNGANIAGNLDAGIYDKAGNRIVSTGSTAHAGASLIQMVDTADVTLTPGVYYLANATDTSGGTQTIARYQMGTIGLMRACGIVQQAIFPLPSAASFATNAQTSVPLVFGAIEGSTF